MTKTQNIKSGQLNKSISSETFLIVGVVVIIARLLLTLITSYKVDMGGYTAWSSHLAQHGPQKLYETFHIVYAPAYMYLLWITGMLAKAFSFDYSTHAYFIKLWAVAAEIIGGYLIYKIGKKHDKEKWGLILGVIYALNPGVFFNSSIWGQFDSIPATMQLGLIYCLTINKKMPAVILFAFSILTKPQSVFLTPLIIIPFYKELLDFSKITSKKIITAIKQTVLALTWGLSCYMVTIFPFYYHTNFYEKAKGTSAFKNFLLESADYFYWMIGLYLKSVDDYPYATANAFNLWTLLGGQPVDDRNNFLLLSYKDTGLLIFIAFVLVAMLYLYNKRKDPFAIYFSSFFVIAGAFTVVTRMHERYMLPAIIFLTVSALWKKWIVAPLAILSICVTANHWYLYHLSWKEIFWLDKRDTIADIFALLTVLLIAFSFAYIISTFLKEETKNNIFNKLRGH